MNEQLISEIRIDGLFGLYSYTLPPEGKLTNAAILYGDNGIGKSTILRLVFHLLSGANNKGHRSALYSTEFKSLQVDLASGVSVKACREADHPHVLTLSVSQGGANLAVWDYLPKSMGGEGDVYQHLPSGEIRVIRAKKQHVVPRSLSPGTEGEHAFYGALAEHVPAIFILNAERRLDSDSVPDPDDEMELRRSMMYEEPKRIADMVVRAREIALSQALSTAGRWIARRAVQGANQGSTNVHTVYANVLRHLVDQPSRESLSLGESDIAALMDRVDSVRARTAMLAKYELETPLDTAPVKDPILTSHGQTQALAVRLITPYIDGLESRLQALEPIYKVTDRFVSLINSLLTDKIISFQLSHGFSIVNRLSGVLKPAQLSSGEQQLLLLFCYVLTARDKPSVFMIDEPEISLNIKWQRQLIQSLLDVTDGADIQFIFASHSLELLSQHRNRVVRLETSA